MSITLRLDPEQLEVIKKSIEETTKRIIEKKTSKLMDIEDSE